VQITPSRILALSLFFALAVQVHAQGNAATFETVVIPVLRSTCYSCHNEQVASGGLNLKALGAVAENREDWEMVLGKLKAGEMPPPPVPKPAGLDAMVSYLEREFERLDRNTQADPGRITARHLNRTEYRNTIRDLLGVDFQTAHEFPVDDSGDGFDNLGDVLSLSPLLAEKYLAAAERISTRALGLVKLPARPVSASYADDDNYTEGASFTGTNGSAHRAGTSFIEVTHRVEFDGDYVIQAGLAGQRGADGKPVRLGFWMDGKLLHSEEVQTTPPNTVYFGAYEKKEFRVFLPEGVHSFRLGFMNDAIGAGMPKDKALNPRFNKYPQLIAFLGPESPAEAPSSRTQILICDPHSGPECVQQILATLAHRAFRRPVKPAEVGALLNLVAATQKEGLSLEEGIQTAVEAILVSPDFLFRIERDPEPTNPARIHRVTDGELASRLSYFLWSSMPDDQLLNLGDTGKLSGTTALDAQIKRMLADPRSQALSENFAGQWLELRNLDAMKPDPDKFPEWNPELKEAMRTETSLFFDSILRENRPISEFLNARYTFLNETLAKFYGIEGVTGPEFRRVELSAGQRGGILGQASVMTVSSYPSRTSVVLRGKYLLENILGSPPPPPPANVPPLDEAATGATLSLRQQMEQHRADPTCASCHSKMDPLGFALEHYDAIGKWRTMDGKFPVDPSGILPDGTTFAGPAEMREALAGKLPQFAECLVRKMMVYALGRGIEPYDRPAIAEIMSHWEADGYRFQSLIFEIAHSLPFQSRRGDAAKEVTSQ
jgi:mono/diheme cytochrome c family protein